MEWERRSGVQGMEGGERWLRPSHVVDDDACRPPARRGTGAFLPTQQPPPIMVYQSPKNNRKFNNHQKRPGTLTERHAAATGGQGMHAVFIDSKPRSCGTGFFLPRCSEDVHMQQSKKPVCSPVLLPSRVAQVLNLNGHVVHPPITYTKEKQQIKNHNPTTITVDKRRDDAKTRPAQEYVVLPQSCSSSLEVLLPEDWSY